MYVNDPRTLPIDGHCADVFLTNFVLDLSPRAMKAFASMLNRAIRQELAPPCSAMTYRARTPSVRQRHPRAPPTRSRRGRPILPRLRTGRATASHPGCRGELAFPIRTYPPSPAADSQEPSHTQTYVAS